MENVHFYFPLFEHFYIDIYTYFRKKDRLEKGKKNTVVDENYLKLAEKMLFSELCLVLRKEKEEVHNLITESVNRRTN